MRRTIWAVLLAGAAAGGGCRMCQNPYDYTGPVVDGNCPTCGHGRSGSVLASSGGYVEGEPAYNGEAAYGGSETAQGPTPAKRR